MKTILQNIRTTTEGLNPVVKVAVYSLLGIIVTGAIALFAGVLITGAPNF